MFGSNIRFEELAAAVQQAKISLSCEVIGAVKEGERVHVLVRERAGLLQPGVPP